MRRAAPGAGPGQGRGGRPAGPRGRAQPGGAVTTTIGTFTVDGLTLREPPAREGCFTVVTRDAEMQEFAPDDPRALRETVHRHMSNEITSLDIAAACLTE